MAYSPASQKKYDDENTVRINVKLNKRTDKEILDMIDALTSQGLSKQAAIKQLILQDKAKD